MTCNRRRLSPEQKNYQGWQEVDTSGLSESKLDWFIAACELVKHFLDGDNVTRLAKEFDCSRNHIYKLSRKCVKLDRFGHPRGFAALLERKTYKRTKSANETLDEGKSGLAGSFTLLLDTYPEIRKKLEDIVLKRRNFEEVHEIRIRVYPDLFKRFKKMCRDVGLTDRDYPLRSKYQGLRSLYIFVEDLYCTHTKEMLAAREGRDAVRRLGSAKLWPEDHALRPFERVAIDGHKVDEFGTIEIDHPFGGTVEVVLPRFWFIPVHDEASRAILGYSIALRVKPTEEDILAAIESALTLWVPRDLSQIPNLEYNEGAGLPSGVFPELVGTQWDTTEFDNDWANLAFSVTDSLMDVVGSDVNAGPVWELNGRPFVERLFGILEEFFSHRKVNTAGSGPSDTRRKQPEKNALKYHMHIDELLLAIDVVVANYNAEMHGGKGYRSPLEVIGHYLANPENLVRTLGPDDQKALDKLGIRMTCKVKGDVKKGIRPFINLVGARYTNELLRDRFKLIGQEISVWIKPNKDIRRLPAFLSSGRGIGHISAQGAWGISFHNLRQRREALDLKIKGFIKLDKNKDPIQEVNRYYAKKAREGGKKAAMAVARYRGSNNSRNTEKPANKERKQEKLKSRPPGKRYSGKPSFVD